ncbi:aminopeptidase [Sporosarcina cascadiensis]|uniref:aminopeptidase n=1 Tax=Sporosarcina cascadiensis TaxID=2660747 RepID=UPI001E471AE2|nr:aminopeptidase [Sporosarcina cascadiensis]
MSQFATIVKGLMSTNFSLDRSASILVLTDRSTEDVGRKFESALKADEWKTDLFVMEDRTKSGEEPSVEAARHMLKYDMVFCLTKHSLTHTVARKQANAKGISVITMPGISEDMFLNGAMRADYSRVEQETIEMTEKLNTFQQVTLYTGSNHKLIIPIGDRQGIASTGVFKEKGMSGNLPSGEAYVAPLEGQAEGTIEINGSIAGIGLVQEPVVLTIKKGCLTEATGTDGEKLLSLLGQESGRLLCELGIGTNHAARLTGKILEDEKAYQTAHIAFGSNHTFGGMIKSTVHIDCVTKQPRIEWDSNISI